jgi:hypothetical protein
MHATTIEIDSGHLSLVTHPDQVAQLIVEAARATSRTCSSDGPPTRWVP